MELYKDLIERVRKTYNIPANYKAYSVGYNVWLAMLHKERNHNIELNSFNPQDDGYDLSKDLGYITGNYFKLVNTRLDHDERLLVLFTSHIKKFFDEYMKGEKIEEKPLDVGPGLYKPVRTMIGWSLSSIPLTEITKPILNDNLFEKLYNEVDSFVKQERVYVDMTLTYKRGILLYGPPGNGKTSFIKYILKKRTDAISVITHINNPQEIDFIEYFLGLDHLKEKLKIIVIEDIDGMSGNSRSEILNFLDGVYPMHKVIFIATTNYPERLDIAIKNRPSRFDTVYGIDLPNDSSRKKLLLSFFKEDEFGETLIECIEKSRGFSGAYFKEVYLYSKLNNLTPVETIEYLIKRAKFFDDCDGRKNE